MIDSKQFAYAVVAGNASEGKTPQEISQKSLELYLAALEVANEFNNSIKTESKQSKSKTETYNALKHLGL